METIISIAVDTCGKLQKRGVSVVDLKNVSRQWKTYIDSTGSRRAEHCHITNNFDNSVAKVPLRRLKYYFWLQRTFPWIL